jgi:hypothetical protein
MRITALALCLSGAFALTACTPSTPSSEPTPPDATAAAPGDAAAPAADATTPVATPTPTTGVWFVPAALKACDPANQVVSVNWNFSEDPSLTGIKIVVPATDEDGVESEGLFAQTAPQGSKDSGPWMGAGSTIIVRDVEDDTELARATVGSIPCQ